MTYAKAISVLSGLGKIVYNNTWVLTIGWVLLTLTWFLKTNYMCCLKETGLDGYLWNTNIVLSALLILFYSAIFVFSSRIQSDERSAIDKTNSSFGFNFAETDIKIIVLPLFYIWFLAASKVILEIERILYGSTATTGFDIFESVVWFLVGVLALVCWRKYKSKAHADRRYSVPYGAAVVLYTLSSIFWEQITPLVGKIILLENCILREIISHA